MTIPLFESFVVRNRSVDGIELTIKKSTGYKRYDDHFIVRYEGNHFVLMYNNGVLDKVKRWDKGWNFLNNQRVKGLIKKDRSFFAYYTIKASYEELVEKSTFDDLRNAKYASILIDLENHLMRILTADNLSDRGLEIHLSGDLVRQVSNQVTLVQKCTEFLRREDINHRVDYARWGRSTITIK